MVNTLTHCLGDHVGRLALFVNCGYSLFGCDGNFDVTTLFELHIITVFISQRIFNSQITVPMVAAVNSDLRLFRLTGRSGQKIIFSTVPGMVVLGCSGIRALSSFSSAILADLVMRGFAISFLTLARVASPGLSLLLLGIKRS